MKNPNTPFSTRLSGSAKETELRLRSIFQWKKKRPPVVLVVLIAVLLLGICGGLVSCEPAKVSEELVSRIEQWVVDYPWSAQSEKVNEDTRWVVETVECTDRRYIVESARVAIYEVKCRSKSGAAELSLTLLVNPDTLEIYPEPESWYIDGKEEPLQSTPDEPENTGNTEETQYGQVVRSELSLDEDGVRDDSIILTIYRDDDGPTGQVEVIVHLGNGETLKWDLSNEENYYFLPELVAAYLTSDNRQSVIVQLKSIASTYGFAQYYVVEVVDGALKVTDLTAGRETLHNFSLIYHPITGMAYVQIQVLGDEVTLGWKDGAWSEVELDPMDAYERNKRQATVAGLDHMPLDKLPQEILDSLTLVSETDLSDAYNPEWGWYRTYTVPGLEIRTSAPSAVYLEWLEKAEKNDRERYPTEEDFYAHIAGEEGREWLIAVTITDDRFATLDGLKVGMTCAQAKELGYSIHEGQNSVGNAEYELYISVENGVVVQMRNVWTMGRYIGKFFEL